MWTPATRRQHNRQNLRYETDLTDREWELIAPMMPATAKTGRPRRWPLRESINAIFYVMRSGNGWRLLPSDFPPGSTVFRWFRRFRDEGLFEKINHRLLMVDDERSGREASPTALVIPRVKPEDRLARAGPAFIWAWSHWRRAHQFTAAMPSKTI